MKKPTYENIDENEYKEKINSPSRSIEYYKKFHAPLIEETKLLYGKKDIRILDIGCGYGFELDFIKNDPNIHLIGLDISFNTLKSTLQRFGKKTTFIVGDVEYCPIQECCIDIGIAVNAVIYKPYNMLSVLYNTLKPNHKCAVNFRTYSKNLEFYEFYIQKGCKVLEYEYILEKGNKKEIFITKLLDYSDCQDIKMKNLYQQMYFNNNSEVERLIEFIGFNITYHEVFNFSSIATHNNKIDVYILQKP